MIYREYHQHFVVSLFKFMFYCSLNTGNISLQQFQKIKTLS